MLYSIESETAISEIFLIINILNDLKDIKFDFGNIIDLSLFFNILECLTKLFEEDDCLVQCLFGYILIFIFDEIYKDNKRINKLKKEEKELFERSIKLFETKLKNDCDEILVSKYEESIFNIIFE